MSTVLRAAFANMRTSSPNPFLASMSCTLVLVRLDHLYEDMSDLACSLFIDDVLGSTQLIAVAHISIPEP